ncbi:XRE family transcriptional regulator [Streptomyces sp. SID14515]|uniref:helix-turn-helix domain-containing protein n=1 Tax=Streptomyces sp. SID14515 TaxID=2706074 RepID=UPI0013C58BA9|nr:XRE family transcriptional regulator [Streptomyces sp. SID14515]NEB38929.1 XRE family transcriptional regulator [Streptomyces sp. SID14515]
MAEWKPLPERLNADVGRLVEELRRAKDATGLSLSALAKATPYSKSSWERFLNGAQLPPRSAVEALAARSGRGDERLLALWEVAESAWSGRARTAPEAAPRSGPPTEAGTDIGTATGGDGGNSGSSGSDVDAALSTDAAGGAEADADADADADDARSREVRPRRKVLAAWTAATAAVAALCVTALIVAPADGPPDDAAPSEAPSAQEPPVKGVEAKCFGSACDGKDAVELGCGGDAWTAAVTEVRGRFVEVRYSSTCRTAWARVKAAHPGDRVRVVREDDHSYDEVTPDDPIRAAFTFMLPAPSPRQVKACWELSTGEQGCTRPGGDKPLPEASPPRKPLPEASPVPS